MSEANCHTTKWFSEHLLAIETNRTKVKMNKPIYFGLSMLEINKTVIFEFWHDYVKPEYQDKANLCYMNTDSFIVNIKTNDVYKDTVIDVEKIWHIKQTS